MIITNGQWIGADEPPRHTPERNPKGSTLVHDNTHHESWQGNWQNVGINFTSPSLFARLVAHGLAPFEPLNLLLPTIIFYNEEALKKEFEELINLWDSDFSVSGVTKLVLSEKMCLLPW
ncbi:unnamed protein product [Toxocara canis]|uniref:Nucleotid_trans domain-containing protein n=1 Tax=Toxocara canis TaxID=6265 RepID=A0A183UMV7_TOXCA|nr:unnamed protein product [Toxocara canis]